MNESEKDPFLDSFKAMMGGVRKPSKAIDHVCVVTTVVGDSLLHKAKKRRTPSSP